MAAKRGLGKGLNSLIPEDSKVASEVKPKVVEKIVEKEVIVKEPTEIKVILIRLSRTVNSREKHLRRTH